MSGMVVKSNAFFRRNYNVELMEQQYELEALVQSVTLVDEEDTLLWKYESNGAPTHLDPCRLLLTFDVFNQFFRMRFGL